MEPHSLILNSTNQTSLQLKPIEAQISVPVTPNFELKLEEDDETYSLVHIAVQFVDWIIHRQQIRQRHNLCNKTDNTQTQLIPTP